MALIIKISDCVGRLTINKALDDAKVRGEDKEKTLKRVNKYWKKVFGKKAKYKKVPTYDSEPCKALQGNQCLINGLNAILDALFKNIDM